MRNIIKQISAKHGKKIGPETIKKVISQINIELDKKLASASRKADFSGRKTIKEEDL